MAKAATTTGSVMTSLSVDAVEQAAVALLARAARPQVASR